ncbi:hypothetical protein T265_02051 [Opisthorchis viverrini]|uniref:Uncharacterized protein n=1 Tax=Opisthorchis viverrini TaxID=6198 RepID=A0A075A807_OPIVI|nr:hypothetical protein T265_02051 [Opisthorchis viverrini]KER31825.1 hypothetical protein T265_02051 [Opisthorchis viverrini]
MPNDLVNESMDAVKSLTPATFHKTSWDLSLLPTHQLFWYIRRIGGGSATVKGIATYLKANFKPMQEIWTQAVSNGNSISPTRHPTYPGQIQTRPFVPHRTSRQPNAE